MGTPVPGVRNSKSKKLSSPSLCPKPQRAHTLTLTYLTYSTALNPTSPYSMKLSNAMQPEMDSSHLAGKLSVPGGGVWQRLNVIAARVPSELWLTGAGLSKAVVAQGFVGCD